MNGSAAAGRPPDRPAPLRAVLFDRDGTLVHDVPYNADPLLVRPMPGAVEAVARARAAGLATGVVSNQSGIGRGLLTAAQVRAVGQRVDALFGRFDVWVVCPHRPDEGCPCRKPRPGMVLAAAQWLGVRPGQCALIGDIGADLAAARAAGARAVIVPTPATRPEEYAHEPAAPDLLTAVNRLLGRNTGRPGAARPPGPARPDRKDRGDERDLGDEQDEREVVS